MRRRGTWLVVGALIALGAIAAADALRGPQEVVAPPGKTEQPAPTVARPGEPAMIGALYYSDANDECRLSGVTVPDLGNPAFDPSTGPPPKLRSCRFTMSPDGEAALQGDVEWSPSGSLHARETRNAIRLGSARSNRMVRLRGRSPAFKPDGTLTYVRDEKLVEWRGRAVFSTRDLRRTMPGQRSLGPLTLRDVAWLTETRLAAVVGVDAGTPASREFFAVIEGERVLATNGGFFGEGHTIEASPGGAYFAEWFRNVLLGVRDRNGREMVLPTVQGVRALTWSPDERWAAVATRFSVFLVRTHEGEARIRRLPIVARDLAWR
jgi:hypothetical protein